MMKKVLADFADDADFSGRNILKFFSRKVSKHKFLNALYSGSFLCTPGGHASKY